MRRRARSPSTWGTSRGSWTSRRWLISRAEPVASREYKERSALSQKRPPGLLRWSVGGAGRLLPQLRIRLSVAAARGNRALVTVHEVALERHDRVVRGL